MTSEVGKIPEFRKNLMPAVRCTDISKVVGGFVVLHIMIKIGFEVEICVRFATIFYVERAAVLTMTWSYVTCKDSSDCLDNLGYPYI